MDLPSIGRLPVVGAVGARVHSVFTGEGLSCPVLSCIVRIHGFFFVLFLFGLICSDFLIHCVF